MDQEFGYCSYNTEGNQEVEFYKERKEKHMLQLNELDEIRENDYGSNWVYKDKVKRWHKNKILRRPFESLGTALVAPKEFKASIKKSPKIEMKDRNPDRTFKVHENRLKHYWRNNEDRHVTSVTFA
ncbi:hypothetical protein ABFS82_11G107100 [Erythranthe guttata]|uniref:uncharacterized protein LOC105953376 n=1 Tax=Erythranthe guttata TaxID=4155 RepID=UPI00064D83F9|nr:PREDICTED: uncharacterized protein LOC105953376 [Erythranthe guttata]|eukprot:XP_012832494.1 PREDICTED: uncharacterized protein LOC105953376 [Erythranthe guttata]